MMMLCVVASDVKDRVFWFFFFSVHISPLSISIASIKYFHSFSVHFWNKFHCGDEAEDDLSLQNDIVFLHNIKNICIIYTKTIQRISLTKLHWCK